MLPSSSRRVRRLGLLVAAALGALAFAGAAQAAPSIASLRIGSYDVANGGDLSRYSYLIVHSWEYRRIPALKAANPNLKVLAYKNMSMSVSYACSGGVDDALLPAGVGYCWADRNRPQWFLTSGGSRLQSQYFTGLWMMDVGSQAYQDQWAANVAAELRANGFDGVMLDDANWSTSFHAGSRRIDQYPTQAAYQAASEAFLARVCPALAARGLLAVPNIQADASRSLRSGWASHCTGSVKEYWTKWGSSSTLHKTDAGLLDELATLEDAQAQNRLLLPITYSSNTDTRSMRYARASFLLAWDGRNGSALIYDSVGTDPWSTEWTIDVGAPLAARYQVGGAWRRDYTGGVVLVNPSASASATVALGASYLMPNGTSVSSVTLAGASGLVLRRPTPLPETIVVDTTPPAAPAGLGATAGDARGALDWADNGEADLAGYKVYRRNGDGTWTAIASTTASAYTAAGLANGTSYAFRVTAYDKASPANESAASAEASATPVAPPPPPDTTPPVAPAGLVATAGDGSVSLAWSASGDADVAGYTVYRLSAGGAWSAVGSSAATAYTAGGLANGTSYTFRVTAYDGASPANESAASAEVSATPVAPPPPPDTTPPAAPTAMVALAGDGSVALDWADNAEADLAGYKVYRRNGDGTWGAIVTVTASAHTVGGLVNGASYTFRVGAYDRATPANESAPSAQVSATPVAPAPAPVAGGGDVQGGGAVVKTFRPSGFVVAYGGVVRKTDGAGMFENEGRALEVDSVGSGTRVVDVHPRVLVTGVERADIDRLTIDFDGAAGAGDAVLTLSVYDWTAGAWREYTPPTSGVATDRTFTWSTVEAPARYVSSGGEVRIRLKVTRRSGFRARLDWVRITTES